jgi:hypothetical protein
MTNEEKLEELRKRWLEAKKSGNTNSMKIIEMRAKLLKMSGPPTLSTEEIEDIFISTDQGSGFD